MQKMFSPRQKFMAMSKFTILTLYLLGGSCFGMPQGTDCDLSYAPPPYDDGGRTLVPIDIEQQHVSWLIAGDLTSVEAVSELTFSVEEAGYPVILLNPNSTGSIVSKGESAPVTLKKMDASPFSKSNFYYIDKILEPGTYELQLKYSFNPDLEKSYFLPIQYNKHAFGEAGIPSNYSYDHFKLTLDVTIKHPTPDKYRFITNGIVTPGETTNSFRAEYPPHYTSMSFFIDVVDSEKVIERKFQKPSIDGREIDFLVYSTWSEVAVEVYQALITWDFPKIEKTFGPYPYQKLIIKTFGAESPTNLAGAFSGAVLMPIDYANESFHEFGHSWYMQNLSPALGDDMWIYEGLGWWAPNYLRASRNDRDQKFNQYIDMSANPYSLSSNLWIHEAGAAVLAEIDGQLQCKGGLLKYLREIHTYKMRDGGIHNRTLSTREFKALLEEYSGENLDEIFTYYFKDY